MDNFVETSSSDPSESIEGKTPKYEILKLNYGKAEQVLQRELVKFLPSLPSDIRNSDLRLLINGEIDSIQNPVLLDAVRKGESFYYYHEKSVKIPIFFIASHHRKIFEALKHHSWTILKEQEEQLTVRFTAAVTELRERTKYYIGIALGTGIAIGGGIVHLADYLRRSGIFQ